MNQNGRGPPLYGSLPCYTLKKPEVWYQPAMGTYKVLRDCEEHTLSTRIPFDTNWGRSDWLDLLPLQATEQANSNTYAAPNAVPLDSQYAPLRYESWDPMYATNFLRKQPRMWQ